jgi:hypothetical protein
MLPFEAHEAIGRERREALAAEAENHRLSRPARMQARMQARRALVGRVASLALSIRRPGLLSGRRPADWDLKVSRPARRAT